RDSINAQLTNVREMLASLTGAAVAAAPSVEDESVSRGVPAQQSR
ncbi:cellulose-binding protein, partial [Streptomyces violaceoruber]